jgi:hypothetical protein
MTVTVRYVRGAYTRRAAAESARNRSPSRRRDAITRTMVGVWLALRDKLHVSSVAPND